MKPPIIYNMYLLITAIIMMFVGWKSNEALVQFSFGLIIASIGNLIILKLGDAFHAISEGDKK